MTIVQSGTSSHTQQIAGYLLALEQRLRKTMRLYRRVVMANHTSYKGFRGAYFELWLDQYGVHILNHLRRIAYHASPSEQQVLTAYLQAALNILCVNYEEPGNNDWLALCDVCERILYVLQDVFRYTCCPEPHHPSLLN